MANRMNKQKIIDEAQCSTTLANKRKRVEIVSDTTGVPFTNPITRFPSVNIFQQNRNPPPTFDMRFPHASTVDQDTADDDLSFSLIPRQNFIMACHFNEMVQGVEDFWRRNLTKELRKIKDVETKLKDKDEQLGLFKQMSHFYAQKALQLEETLRLKEDDAGPSTPAPTVVPEEGNHSCLVDLNSLQRADMACKHCRDRPATMLWLPCRHLCVCLVCDRRVKICPICSVRKTESLMINMHLQRVEIVLSPHDILD